MKPELEPVFEAYGTLDSMVDLGETPKGRARVVPITGGRFEGPRLRGVILPGGADWQILRGDAVLEVEARYLLRTDDDVLIGVHNCGLRRGSAQVMQRLAAGESVDPAEYYFRAAPTFNAPAGRYQWLNESIFVCAGARYGAAIRLWVHRIT